MPIQLSQYTLSYGACHLKHKLNEYMLYMCMLQSRILKMNTSVVCVWYRQEYVALCNKVCCWVSYIKAKTKSTPNSTHKMLEFGTFGRSKDSKSSSHAVLFRIDDNLVGKWVRLACRNWRYVILLLTCGRNNLHCGFQKHSFHGILDLNTLLCVLVTRCM